MAGWVGSRRVGRILSCPNLSDPVRPASRVTSGPVRSGRVGRVASRQVMAGFDSSYPAPSWPGTLVSPRPVSSDLIKSRQVTSGHVGLVVSRHVTPRLGRSRQILTVPVRSGPVITGTGLSCWSSSRLVLSRRITASTPTGPVGSVSSGHVSLVFSPHRFRPT
jgi:hypothetical protein